MSKVTTSIYAIDRAVSKGLAVSLVLVVTIGCKAGEYYCSDLDPIAGMPGMAKFTGAGEEAMSQARADFRKKIESGSIGPGRGYFCLGRALYDSGDSEGSIDLFTKSIDADPGRVLPYFGRAIAASDVGQCAQAIEDYTHVLRQGARTNEVLLMRAGAYAQCEQAELAKADLQDYEARVGERRRTDRYFEVRRDLGAVPSESRLAQEISYYESEVKKFSTLSSCTPEAGFCSMPRLVSAVDDLTDALCKAGNVDRAKEIFATYRHYEGPVPNRPSCIDGAR